MNRAEECGREPGRGRRGGRQDGRGRRRGRGEARNQTDYWSLAKPEFRRWLSNITTRTEYNILSIAERRELLRDFGTQSNDATLKRIEDKLDNMATISVGMPEADQDFTRELLGSKGIIFKTLPVCKEGFDGAFSDRIYKWGKGEDEKDGQPGCKSMLERELLPLSLNGRGLGIFDVRGLALPEVHGGKRKSNGFSDLAIGDFESLSLPDTRDLTFGLSTALIELITGEAALKQGQLLLQLVSLSTISNAQKVPLFWAQTVRRNGGLSILQSSMKSRYSNTHVATSALKNFVY